MRGFCTATILVAALASASPMPGQGTELTPREIVQRDALLQPGVDAMKKDDPATALGAFRLALAAFPNDSKVLRFSALAAMDARQNDEALGLFQRVLAQHPADPWPARFAIMVLEARLARWTDFDANLVVLKTAKQANDPNLKDPGFIVEEFDVNGKRVDVAVFPLLAGPFHTLYRFILQQPAQVETSASTQSGGGDRCKDPNFRPYIDVESDDIDQEAFKRQHPELAAKGERSYSLDTYPAPCSQGLIKFYFEGEPKYEVVRADVIKALSGAEKPAKP